MEIPESVFIGNHNVIQHGAVIEDNSIIMDHCFIGYYSIIRPNVFIGCHTDIRAHCFIAEGAHIAAGVKVFQFSNVGAGTIIERKAYLGPRVLITNTKRISNGRSYTPKIEPVVIRFGARIGGGAVLLPGVEIGANSVIGAGSVVTKSIPDNVVAVGNPAKIIKEIQSEEILDEGVASIQNGLCKCGIPVCPKFKICGDKRCGLGGDSEITTEA